VYIPNEESAFVDVVKLVKHLEWLYYRDNTEPNAV
jgi:hypothetical protein